MKKSLLVLALAAALAPSFAMAEAGDFVVRLRATNVAPSEKSNLGAQTDATYGTGIAQAFYGSPNAKLSVDNNTIPELDISYYFTKNIAAELILALGTRHDVNVTSAGAVSANLGSVNLLPPTLTAQWHFNPDQTFDPYLGAGMAYVLGMDRSLTAHTATEDHQIRIDRNSFGAVFQAGFDINLKDKWLLNVDVKKLYVGTDVELNVSNGGFRKIDSLDLNPLLVSVGFGKKF
jgi:outer membrane protein